MRARQVEARMSANILAKYFANGSDRENCCVRVFYYSQKLLELERELEIEMKMMAMKAMAMIRV